MATLGTMVLYTFDAAQASILGQRGGPTGNFRLAGIPDPTAGTTLPALVVHDYGSNVHDLKVFLRGGTQHLVQNVIAGTAGQQGRYSAVV
ncbi:hypothetical protein JIG36_37380 [Actinoplanes sp. LDG1-06]|uniref:Uncharacterized protein n=1 Tax=Paractinoplanes ovalisporus TaxID=2810368 RepID=A0ABS2AN35_9ACTN|nr:hypothetical protein [Actinoplanes ovalisporus]MBM2621190.1 hypothetical protein [Actinoplanes ovalisporus]